MAPKFRLQTLLDIRHSQVEALEIELSQLLISLRQTEQYLESLLTQQDRLYQELQASQSGVIDLFAVEQLRSNLRFLAGHITEARFALSEASARVDAKRKEVTAAKQAEEVLDILKDKQLQAYAAEQNLMESKQQDDIYIAKAYRQQRMAE